MYHMEIKSVSPKKNLFNFLIFTYIGLYLEEASYLILYKIRLFSFFLLLPYSNFSKKNEQIAQKFRKDIDKDEI